MIWFYALYAYLRAVEFAKRFWRDKVTMDFSLVS